MADGHGGSHGQGRAAFYTMLARRTRYDEKLMLAFILSMLAVAVAFCLLHLLRRLGQGHDSAARRGSRRVRRLALRDARMLPSVGHAAIVGLYFAVNLIVGFVRINDNGMPLVTNVASRAAWLALGNLVVVILALKNTPLAVLTARSYERLNVLHRVAGYTTLALVVHASSYSAYFVQSGRPERLLHFEEIYGMVAGLSFVVLGFAAAVVRRWWYELFYYIHVIFWVLAIIMIGLHQPDLSKKVVAVAGFVAAVWLLDRLVRLVRLALNGVGNSVRLTPLPGGSTRVTLARPPRDAVAGKHGFLWLPSVRLCETHPFTLSSAAPLEFVVASHDGFTRDLHTHALSHPGVLLRASVGGTYGHVPDAAAHSTVVLVAGGSGASFTLGVAANVLANLTARQSKQIVFVWTVKHTAHLDWFHDQLLALCADHRVRINLFVTRDSHSPVTGFHDAEPQPPSPMSTGDTDGDLEKAMVPSFQSQDSAASVESKQPLPCDTSPLPTHFTSKQLAEAHGIAVSYHRPDVSALITAAIDGTPRCQRALLLCCGPDQLTTQVRNTTARCIQPDGPGIYLHCERFGW